MPACQLKPRIYRVITPLVQSFVAYWGPKIGTLSMWSRLSDSNRKPDAYKATALAVELRRQSLLQESNQLLTRVFRRHMVGNPRLERGTSVVSGQRSTTELIADTGDLITQSKRGISGAYSLRYHLLP